MERERLESLKKLEEQRLDALKKKQEEKINKHNFDIAASQLSADIMV